MHQAATSRSLGKGDAGPLPPCEGSSHATGLVSSVAALGLVPVLVGEGREGKAPQGVTYGGGGDPPKN